MCFTQNLPGRELHFTLRYLFIKPLCTSQCLRVSNWTHHVTRERPQLPSHPVTSGTNEPRTRGPLLQTIPRWNIGGGGMRTETRMTITKQADSTRPFHCTVPPKNPLENRPPRTDGLVHVGEVQCEHIFTHIQRILSLGLRQQWRTRRAIMENRDFKKILWSPTE